MEKITCVIAKITPTGFNLSGANTLHVDKVGIQFNRINNYR